MNYSENPQAVLQQYPAPYYASYDNSAAQPTRVTGWYAIRGMSSLNNVPPASSMIPLTEEEWKSFSDSQKAMGLGVMGGKIVEYTPPPIPVPIKTQAEQAYNYVMSQAAFIVARGKSFGDQTNYYINALEDIINGKVTPGSLPEKPSDFTL